MKKWFLVLLFSIFFFLPFSVSAEAIDVPCNSDLYEGKYCGFLDVRVGNINSEKDYNQSGFIPYYSYQINGVSSTAGISNIYSAYMLVSNSLYADFKANKKYEIIYTFTLSCQDCFDVNDGKDLKLNSNNFIVDANDGTTNYGDYDAFSYYNFGIKIDTSPDGWKTYHYIFDFVPKKDMKRFGFLLGDNLGKQDFISFFTNKSASVQFLQYTEFSMKQVDEFSIVERKDEITNSDVNQSIKDQTEVSKGIWGTIKDMFSKIGDILGSLTEGFINVVKKIGEIATDIIVAIIDLGADLLKGIGTLLSDIVLAIGGFFETLGGWIADGIIAIGEFFTKLGQFILDTLKFLFIPADGFLDIYLHAMDEFLTDKLGILYFPISFIIDFLNRFINLRNTVNPIITIPNIAIGGFGTLIHGTTWDISAIWHTSPYNQIYDIYIIFVSFFVGYCIYRLAVKKYAEFFGGGSH